MRDGVVIAAAGPLDTADAEPMLLDHLDYSRYEAAWIKKKLSDFVRIALARSRAA